ncbi:MAG: GntR family transcriptional regulator [Oscillospiraceae bacterium]|nr:GntR family transcriptional regulator [Oscillospiraceae bacterium]
MKQTAVPPHYLQIALDLARRIARLELPEGSQLYGRSLLASEYNVSPETIRRAVRLLANMKVVAVKPQSGVVVLSTDSARRYIANFEESAGERALRSQLKALAEEHEALGRKLNEAVDALSRHWEASSETPFPNYEIPVPKDSPLIGKTVGESRFWQCTGGTIVAIRRGRSLILSPGPYMEFYAGDIIVLVGTPPAVTAARKLVTQKEETDDPI